MAVYEVTSEALVKRINNLRTRTWRIEADSIDDACYQARMNHLALTGWNSTIAVSVHGWCRDIQSGQWVEDRGQAGVLR